MGKLQTGRFERLSARTYSIKGPGALVDLDETVLGVILLERQGGMESHLIQQWETFGVLDGRGAVAGQYSWILISNPVDSGTLVVIDSWTRNDPLRMRVFRTLGVPPGFVPGLVGVGLDSRIPFSRQPTARVFSQNNAIAGFGQQIMETESPTQIHYPVVLGPDGAIVFRSGLQNEPLEVGIRWAERPAQPFEL
jgi:hypothetical protein